MSLIPINRRFDPLNTWGGDVTPYDWDREYWQPLRSYEPFAVTNRYDPALARSQQTVNTFSPLLVADLVESDNDFHVMVSKPNKFLTFSKFLTWLLWKVDLPGVVPEDIQVNIDRGFLELKAERKEVHREDDGFNRRIERSFGI